MSAILLLIFFLFAQPDLTMANTDLSSKFDQNPLIDTTPFAQYEPITIEKTDLEDLLSTKKNSVCFLQYDYLGKQIKNYVNTFLDSACQKSLEMPRFESKKKSKKEKNSLPPLLSMITSPYGERRLGGPSGIRMHHGVDIRAHIGWPIVAFADGVVKTAGYQGAAGIMVEIKHDDGLSTMYAHMRACHVQENQIVKQGQVIGEVGCTGRTSGAHLHFAVYDKNHASMNPLKFLTDAYQVLAPEAHLIPKNLGPQQCNGQFSPYVPANSGNYSSFYGRRQGPVIRNRRGRAVRIDLNALRNYTPPEIPLWNSRKR
ncbi:MAG: M23 family metallopeptidase [Desulfovibrio sp.]|nr:M23 family metallopeptidase [Desulfovibrio sp.]